MANQNDRAAGTNQLHSDVLGLVLERLPIKWILCCKAVCREWYTLITSSSFIKEHGCVAETVLLVHTKSYLGNEHIFSLLIDGPDASPILQDLISPLEGVFVHVKVLGKEPARILYLEDMGKEPARIYLQQEDQIEAIQRINITKLSKDRDVFSVQELIVEPVHPLHQILGFWRNNDIIALDEHRDLVSYEIPSFQVQLLPSYAHWGQPNVSHYSESLVWPF